MSLTYFEVLRNHPFRMSVGVRFHTQMQAFEVTDSHELIRANSLVPMTIHGLEEYYSYLDIVEAQQGLTRVREAMQAFIERVERDSGVRSSFWVTSDDLSEFPETYDGICGTAPYASMYLLLTRTLSDPAGTEVGVFIIPKACLFEHRVLATDEIATEEIAVDEIATDSDLKDNHSLFGDDFVNGQRKSGKVAKGGDMGFHHFE